MAQTHHQARHGGAEIGNIIIRVNELRTIIAAVSSFKFEKDGFRNSRADFDDPRVQLVLDVMRMIESTFKDVADKKRLTHFMEYHLADHPSTYRMGLQEYYMHRLDRDIQSFNAQMRNGGYFIGRR